MWVGGGGGSGLGSRVVAGREVRSKVRAAHAVALSGSGAAAVCAGSRAGVLGAPRPSGRVRPERCVRRERPERRSREGASGRLAGHCGPGRVSRGERRGRREDSLADLRPAPGSAELPAAPLPAPAARLPPPPSECGLLSPFPPLGLHVRSPSSLGIFFGSWVAFSEISVRQMQRLG